MAYTNYARQPVTFAIPSPEGQGIGIRNNSQITFPQSPTNAGTVRYIGIYDAVTGGNMYLYGELAEDLPVTQGDSPVLLIDEVLFFSIGDLSFAYKTRLFNVIRGQTLDGISPSPFVALFNGDPETGGSELAGSNYARAPIVFSAPDKEMSGITITRNIQRVNFNRPTADWGNWTWTALYDAATAGECVWKQQRSTAKQLSRGIMPFVEANAMTAGIN
ncbi:MAG: hypothetical protein FWF15_03470 [Oscillospiraceae bacterium]|nr:hypothetical protein [Oscillospiraceae bacterium]